MASTEWFKRFVSGEKMRGRGRERYYKGHKIRWFTLFVHKICYENCYFSFPFTALCILASLLHLQYESFSTKPAPGIKAPFLTLRADFTCDEEMELAMLCCGKCVPSTLPCCPAKSLHIRDSARLMMSRIRWINPSLSEGRMNSLCTWKKKKRRWKKKKSVSDRGYWAVWRKNKCFWYLVMKILSG